MEVTTSPSAEIHDLPKELLPFLGFVLGKSYQRWQTVLAPHLRTLGLSDSKQPGMMALIYFQGEQSQIELGRKMRIDRTTIVKLLDDLERGGLVERKPNPQDRRANLLSLTPKGTECLLHYEKMNEAAQREFFEPLSEEEQKMLLVLLRKLIMQEVNKA